MSADPTETKEAADAYIAHLKEPPTVVPATAACNCDASADPPTGHRPWCGTEPTTAATWDDRPMFALDADVTVYWPDVRPCYEEAPDA